MGVNEPGGATSRAEPAGLRVTDQALAALRIAATGALRHRETVGDLLIGLAIEPEGLAGPLLRERPGALADLQAVGAAVAPLAPTSVALQWAAGDVAGRPLWTVDLLIAAVEVGGSDLADLLERCGLDPGRLRSPARPSALPASPADAQRCLAETWGFDPSDRRHTLAAGRAIARTRAVDGGAVTLVLALAVEASMLGDVPVDPDEVELRWAGALRQRTQAADRPWDAGLDAVLHAAAQLRGAQPLRATDLLLAAVLVGGSGPAFLLGTDDQPGG